MALILSGTDGLSDVDGSAATPAIRGTDANTGIFFPAADTIAFSEGGVEVARLDSSGNLGIGTTSPSVRFAAQKASGAGTVGSFSDGTAGVDLAATATGGSVQAFDTNQTIDFKTYGTGTLNFFTNNTERARIDSSGNFCIGTTNSDPSGNSVTGFVWNIAGAVTANRSNNAAFFIGRSTSTGTTVQFRYNGADVGNIATNGSTTSYNASSDYRLKNNIATMTGALSKVAQLRPVTFKWNSTGSDAEGFIAHELAEVCPDAVTGEKDAVDENGKPAYQGVDTSFLVATLTAAIQEQQAIIESLKARLDAANL